MTRTHLVIFFICIISCSKKEGQPPINPPTPGSFSLQSATINGAPASTLSRGIALQPSIRLSFSAPVKRSTVAGILLNTANGTNVPYTLNYQSGDSVLLLHPGSALLPLTKYIFTVSSGLQSTNGGILTTSTTAGFFTGIDSADKFPAIPDSALVELVQRQTFKYFWDFAHPVSGLARERNTSGDLVTSGGSGFGIMAVLVGIHRGFITRSQGLTRLQAITAFLKSTAQQFHGAYPHWINGASGIVIPFSAKDNGADLVETSYLIQGLLCARQYFNGPEPAEASLRADINAIWHRVEWTWFRRSNENVLYWHWSPNNLWDISMQIKGWNEALITYILAASSPTQPVPKAVYDAGWAGNGTFRNGNTYFGYQLPLGPNLGGPLFFEHYSFLTVNPFGLSDAYANYQLQAINHTKINYEYVKANPRSYYGYSDQNWGLTASDIPNGYAASSPTNDLGVIAPTAALSSFPYTPAESMKALRFFYYKLGDRLWGDYGFKDAFSLHEPWFADSYLAIDQGPIIVMMENYRSGLLWNLFMSCPEIKAGMRTLGFQGPQL
jgi:hypothetical protein